MTSYTGYATESEGLVFGEYEVVGKLGEGGMGAVYAVIHPVIGKRAAVKVITSALSRNEEAIGRFVREARAVNEIRHPNVVDIFGFGELPDGRHYLVMEHLEGSSLGARLEGGPIPVRQALAILEQIAETVEAVHQVGIVHRDLKPDNVFLLAGKEPKIKLLDFGIAKLMAKAAGKPDLTSTGEVLGSPLYMAPEQVQGGAVAPPTDVYALGVLAYEMLLGAVPFAASTAVEAAAKHLYEPPPDPRTHWPGIRPMLADLLLAMLDKDRNRRPTPREVRRTLAAVSEELSRHVGTGGAAHDDTAVADGEGEFAQTVERPPRDVAPSVMSAAGPAPAPVPADWTAVVSPPQHRPKRRAIALGALVLAGVVAVGTAALVGTTGEQEGAGGEDAPALGLDEEGGPAREVIVEPLSDPLAPLNAATPADAGPPAGGEADAAARPARSEWREARPKRRQSRRRRSTSPSSRQPDTSDGSRRSTEVPDDPNALIDVF